MCHWKAHTQFYLKHLTWSDNNNMYLRPVVVAQQVLDPSPQHPHLREEKKGGGHTRCSQVFRSLIPGSRYWSSPDVYGKVSYIFNCIIYLVFTSVPLSHI